MSSASWRARALLLVVSTLLALGVGEGLARLLDVDPHPAAAYRFHPRYGWKQTPNAMRLRTSATQESNSGDEVARNSAEPAAGPRILVLGDSFTFAVEQPWPRTFAGILAADAESRGGKVLTLSSGGWGTAQEYLALIHEGLAWKPDVVVLQIFPFNDLCNNSIELAHTCSWQDHWRPYVVDRGNGRIEQTWLQPVRGRLRSVSRLVGLLDRLVWSRRMGSPGDSREEFRRRTREFTRANARAIGLEHEGQVYSLFPAAEQPEPVRRAWAATEALFGAIRDELDRQGIPLVAVVIPFSKTFAPEWRDYRRHRPRLMERDFDTRNTEEILSRLGVPIVSLRRRIEQHDLVASELFNRRNRHLSAAGHRWTARWLLEAMISEGTLARATRPD